VTEVLKRFEAPAALEPNRRENWVPPIQWLLQRKDLKQTRKLEERPDWRLLAEDRLFKAPLNLACL